MTSGQHYPNPMLPLSICDDPSVRCIVTPEEDA